MRHEVAEYYEQTYRQVDQQLEGAQQLVAQRTLSPARPYPVRPKNRVSTSNQSEVCNSSTKSSCAAWNVEQDLMQK